jgi:hypothetical protein
VSSSVSKIPPEVVRIAEAMAGYPRPWALCGGWAIDAWLGRKTRDHLDLDITTLIEDGRVLRDHLEGWHLVAHDAIDPGPTEEVWDGRELALPAHLHARPPGDENLAALRAWTTPPYRAAEDGFDFDFQFNASEGDELVLNDAPSIRAPLDRYTQPSPWDVPTMAPELLLFWKATAYFFDPRFEKRNEQDRADFAALLPSVMGVRRAWLREAIAARHPDHPLLRWIDGEGVS